MRRCAGFGEPWASVGEEEGGEAGLTDARAGWVRLRDPYGWTWPRTSPEELRRVRAEMERHEVASQAYETAGLQILELAQTAYSSYVAKNPHEQARLIKTLVSNSTFDRGSLSPTYVKPFDVFAKGSETGDWLLGLDSNQQPSG